MPIVFSFFAEVLSREKRGEHLSWLCMFWMVGEIYASAMAWAIIPHYGEFYVKLSAKSLKSITFCNLLETWQSSWLLVPELHDFAKPWVT